MRATSVADDFESGTNGFESGTAAAACRSLGHRKSSVYGIPCFVSSARQREAIRAVLQQIKQHAPEDFDRIKSRVMGFEFSQRKYASLWIRILPRRRSRGPFYFNGPVTVDLPQSGKRRLSYVLGHILAGICIRETDLYESVPKYGCQKQAEEACVAGYIFRWGGLGKTA